MKRGAETEKKMRQDNEKDNDKTKSLETLRSLHGVKKLQYIWDYYKLPIAVGLILLYMIGYTVYRHVTHKDTVLYAGLINVSVGSDLEAQLGEGFLADQGVDTSKNTLNLYTGWYLTDDEMNEYHEYTYATRMKVLAALDSEQLDVVLMNREAFDAFAQNGYLYNIEELLQETDPALYEKLKDAVVSNMEILEDNAEDMVFDSTLEYVSETTEYPMAIDLSEAGMIRDAGFEDTVYFGIVGNTPRRDTAVAYLRYLFAL